MSELLQAWIQEASACPAVLGCGVQAGTDLRVASRRPDLTNEQITKAMKDLADAVHLLQQNQFPAERLRWTFERGRIHCACGRGGVMAVLVVNHESAASPDIERLLGKLPADSLTH